MGPAAGVRVPQHGVPLPERLQRPLTTVFLIGLPIALVLAWYHGDRGHQRVSGREFAIVTVLLLFGGGLFWWGGNMPDTSAVTTAPAVAAYLADNLDIPDLQLVRSHPYLWVGDFERVGDMDQSLTGESLSWERFRPGFRNSPAFKRKLEEKGVLPYWRTQGFPPQCRAVGAKDFTCD